MGRFVAAFVASASAALGGQPARGADIVVDPTKTVQTLSDTFHGINESAFWDNAQGTAGSATSLAMAPFTLLRFPGGTPSSWYDWQCPYWDGKTCPTTVTPASWSQHSPTDAWHYGQRFGVTTMLFQTNAFGKQNITSPGQTYGPASPASAAAWAQWAKAKGVPAIWEVGNEQDNSSASDKLPMDQYIALFNADADAIHGVDKAYQVFGPASTNEYFWWAQDSLGAFLAGAGNRTGSGKVDGVSLHFYRGQNWNDTHDIAQYWQTGPWPAIQKAIAAHDTRKLPVFMSEWHAGGSTAAFDPTMANALVTADLIGAYALTGVAGSQFFAIHGVDAGSTAFGLLYGNGESRPVDSPTPVLYAMALWRTMGRKVLSLTQTANPSTEVSSWATGACPGSVQVLSINKGAATQSLHVALAGVSLARRTVRLHTLNPATDLTSLDAVFNGQKNPTVPPPPQSTINVGAQFSYDLGGYSIGLADIDCGGDRGDAGTPSDAVASAPDATAPDDASSQGAEAGAMPPVAPPSTDGSAGEDASTWDVSGIVEPGSDGSVANSGDGASAISGDSSIALASAAPSGCGCRLIPKRSYPMWGPSLAVALALVSIRRRTNASRRSPNARRSS